MIGTCCNAAVGLTLALLLGAAPAAAQESRDPTIAPAETGAAGASPTGTEGMTVLMRDGAPYLVVGTRLYAPGDKVGNLRVERISETEVWFHDGTALIKVARFGGIVRKAIAPKPLCAATAAAPSAEPAVPPRGAGRKKSGKKKSTTHRTAKANPAGQAANPPPAVAPCEDTQP